MLRQAVAALLLLLPISLSTFGQSGPRALDVVGGVSSDHVLVSIKPEVFQQMRGLAGANVAAALQDPRDLMKADFKAAMAQSRATGMRPLYRGPFRDPALASQLGLDRVYVIDLPQGSDVANTAAAFARTADIETSFTDTIGGVSGIPNDTDFNLLYGMHNTGQTGGTADADIDAVEAWDIHTGDLGTVVVAIIDSGVNPHTEFGDRLIPGQNIVNPGDPLNTTDTCPHGTHVAGTAAAAGDNGVGVAGVTWGANIMPVRVVTGCNGFVSQLAAGIQWAADNGADVLNMSLQYYNLSIPEAQNLQNVVNYAYGLGIVLVAAAGNNNLGGIGVIAYPARLNNVIAVTATDHNDAFASFSNSGPQAAISAPGKDIRSTWISNGYAYQFGTSMASPHVAGAAALLWSYEPSLTPVQIYDLLRYSTDDRGLAGWDSQFGEGRLNVGRAMAQAPCMIEGPLLEVSGMEEPALVKSRAITLVPGNPGVPTALRVKLVSLHQPTPPYAGGGTISYASLEGKYRWVGPPVEYVESSSSQIPFTAAYLQCTPYYRDWGTIGTLHVFGAEIVPSSQYEVQSIVEGCPTKSSFVFSAPSTYRTGRWGDVEIPFNPPSPSQQPDLSDVAAMVNKFRNVADAPVKARTILTGSVPNLTNDLDFAHISACVDAFRGMGFPHAPPANCP